FLRRIIHPGLHRTLWHNQRPVTSATEFRAKSFQLLTSGAFGPMRDDFESLLQEFYEALLLPGDICVDVGAHVGRHTLPSARRVGRGAEVDGFEPIPFCVEALRELARKAPAPVSVYPLALSDYEGQSDFILAANLPEYSGLKERVYDQPVEKRHLTVEVRRL